MHNIKLSLLLLMFLLASSLLLHFFVWDIKFDDAIRFYVHSFIILYSGPVSLFFIGNQSIILPVTSLAGPLVLFQLMSKSSYKIQALILFAIYWLVWGLIIHNGYLYS